MYEHNYAECECDAGQNRVDYNTPTHFTNKKRKRPLLLIKRESLILINDCYKYF